MAATPLMMFLPFLMLKEALSCVPLYVFGCFRGQPVVSVTRLNQPFRKYGRGGYYYLSSGDVLHDQYQAISLLGSGGYAALWLAQDLRTHERVALKILVEGHESTKEVAGWDEVEMLTILRDAGPQSPGYQHICHLRDNFVVEASYGSHICVVLEPMGPSVRELAATLPDRFRLAFTKHLTRHVLLALDYLHSVGIVHTDIKCDNILVNSEPIPVSKEPIKIKVKDVLTATFKLIDFGAANKMTHRLAQQIQPIALRSPEVIVGAEWDTKTDIWNFGCIIYEILCSTTLFAPRWENDKTGLSPTETHLAQMVGLLGNFPPQLLARGKRSGQYFDSEGYLLKMDLTYDTTLATLLYNETWSWQEIMLAADFLAKMLVIDPEQRWSAAQLLQHPWLKE